MTLSTTRNIMTLEEVADYLRVPTDVVLQASGTITQADRLAAQARNPEIMALLDSWDQPEHAAEQTETWNLLESALEAGRSL
jgi:hypothetical protein